MGAALYANFGWFREQTCVVVCPYGRLQGVLITSTALALAVAASATPAAAQYGGGGSAPPQQMPNNGRQQADEAPQAQKQQPGIKPSGKALKALVELQDAVNKNDTANIPAKLAAAIPMGRR